MGATGMEVSRSPIRSLSNNGRIARSVVMSVAIVVVLVAFAYIFSTAFGFNCFESSAASKSSFCSGTRQHHHNNGNDNINNRHNGEHDHDGERHHSSNHHKAASASPPSPPPVPATFSDPNAIEFYNLSGVVLPSYYANVSFWCDNTQSLLRTDVVQVLYGIPYNISSVLTATSAFESIQGLCRPTGGAYQNEFIWLPYSTYESTQNVTQFSGRTIECDWFEFTPSSTQTLRLCVAADSAFVRLEVISPTGVVIVDFSSAFSTAPFDPSVFNVSPQCYENVTCSEGPTQMLEVYNFHGVNDFTLNNTNVADLPGDANFFCAALISKAFPYFEWISQWQIEVNSTWGEYAFCNFGSCILGDEHLVGREAANGLGQPLAGQCVDNGLVGTWYSLPVAAGCQANQSIGDNGCTWKVLQRSKTINASCLLEQGIENVCKEEIDQIPFLNTQKMFAAAFLSDDPSQGGCPPIDPGTLPFVSFDSDDDSQIYPLSFLTRPLEALHKHLNPSN
eukprot:TRINITY_DN1293_c0_g6_i1.p1 TRINITY_DN1293_c0_g6~~TRINITY_DN1293_c0_g6_i1.p1  ORF type:complete len:506 (-),score=98.62 TRINITY_DN1293_c0_g6_i1:108-1625(-)